MVNCYSQLITFTNDSRWHVVSITDLLQVVQLQKILWQVKFIAGITSALHSYDIIKFDVEKAFDKAANQHVIDAVTALVIDGSALSW